MKRFVRFLLQWASVNPVFAILLAVFVPIHTLVRWLAGTLKPIHSAADAIGLGATPLAFIVVFPALLCILLGFGFGPIDAFIGWRRSTRPRPGKRR